MPPIPQEIKAAAQEWVEEYRRLNPGLDESQSEAIRLWVEDVLLKTWASNRLREEVRRQTTTVFGSVSRTIRAAMGKLEREGVLSGRG